MKKYTFNFSRILVSALIATTLGTKANEGPQAPHHLTGIVLALDHHLKKELKTWCNDFLNSGKSYPQLISELEAHIKSFDDKVLAPIEAAAQNTAMSDSLTKLAHEIVTDLRKMSDTMHKNLRSLMLKNSNLGSYISVMKELEKSMTSNFGSALKKLQKFQAACKNHKELLHATAQAASTIEAIKTAHQDPQRKVLEQCMRWAKEKAVTSF